MQLSEIQLNLPPSLEHTASQTDGEQGQELRVQTIALNRLEDGETQTENSLEIPYPKALQDSLEGFSFVWLHYQSEEYHISIDNIMLNTFFSMEREMTLWDRKTPTYYPRVLDANRKRLSHAFFFIPEGAYFVPPLRPLLGSYKKVKHTFSLNQNMPEFMRLRVKKDQNNERDERILAEDNQEFLKEIYILNQLHQLALDKKIEACKYWSPPFIRLTIVSRQAKKRDVVIQQKFSLTGEKLDSFQIMQIIHVFQSLAIGLHGIHQLGWVHGDMKLSNFVLHREFKEKKEEWMAKIIDFGFATQIGKIAQRGTYPSPEEIENYGKNNKSEEMKKTAAQDCFALGITIISLFCFRGLIDQYIKDLWNKCLGISFDVVSLLKPLGLLGLLSNYIYIKGLTDEIKTIVIDTMIHVQSRNSVTSDNIERMKQLFNAVFLLLEKDPRKRMTCEQAAEVLQQLEMKWIALLF